MLTMDCDVAVIGAGPAGLAASVAARNAGAQRVVIIERDDRPGGILQQCIHPGFGLKYFKEELTGPEYAFRFVEKAQQAGVEVLLGTMVLRLEGRKLICASKTDGIVEIDARAVILAMGCRERTRANIRIPGSRPAGIYTAGSAQRLLNMEGYLVGHNIVILGSGDIGMIMARRLTLEGAKVKAVVEIMPYLAGLVRNKVQCLDDFGIELMLSHTITDISGNNRLESVTVSPVDSNMRPILSENRKIECDTLLLSVGLIPENELSMANGTLLSSVTKGAEVNQFMETSIPGVFACGNVLHVNDLVDNVSAESETAGVSAALYAKNMLADEKSVATVPGNNIRYVCPQCVVPSADKGVTLFFRVKTPQTSVRLIASSGGKTLTSRKVIRVNPGEMQSLTIKKEDVEALTSEIVVTAVKEE
jgi:NADPH-dependent 2,4-dienoyl-CoA reductase/sulfur reductase-like enzyme